MEEKKEEVKQEGEFKVKKKPGRPKKLTSNKKETPKIEFKKEEDAVQESKTEETLLQPDEKKEEQNVGLQEVGSTHKEESVTKEIKEEVTPIAEITEDEQKEVKDTEKKLEEAIRDEKVLGKKLPENIE